MPRSFYFCGIFLIRRQNEWRLNALKKINQSEDEEDWKRKLPADQKAAIATYICVWLIIQLWHSSAAHFNVLSHQPHPSLSPKFRLHGDGCWASAHRPAHSTTADLWVPCYFEVAGVRLSRYHSEWVCRLSSTPRWMCSVLSPPIFQGEWFLI